MTEKRIGVLPDGFEVRDRHRSHLMEDEDLLRYIKEALLEIDVDVKVPIKAYVHDFGHVIGEQRHVETTDTDEIFYARRKNRKGLSRFVKREKGIPTSKLTIVLMKNMQDDEQYYVLITGFYGGEVSREPWDPNAGPNSKEFWNTHAYISKNADIIPGTETTECPW